MRGVLIGIALGFVLFIVAIVAFVTLYSGPELSVQASAPEAVDSGQPFDIQLRVFNPHDEVVMLDSIDVDNEVFEAFEVLSVTPAPTSNSPSPIFGQKSWAFFREVGPGEQQTVVFELVSNRAGTFQLPFDVCNTYQDCSRNLLAVRVH